MLAVMGGPDGGTLANSPFVTSCCQTLCLPEQMLLPEAEQLGL